jgi:hypothetical protein
MNNMEEDYYEDEVEEVELYDDDGREDKFIF